MSSQEFYNSVQTPRPLIISQREKGESLNAADRAKSRFFAATRQVGMVLHLSFSVWLQDQIGRRAVCHFITK